MATQKPLVIIDGAIQQIPAGDTLEGIPGGAAVESTTLTLDRQSMSHEQILSRPGTLPTQSVRAWLVDSIDNDVWQLENVNINAIAETDQITFYLSSQYFESGSINVNFEVK
jgi:hypothetical protein